MEDVANYSSLAKRYGLAPLPDSVTKLTQLVAAQHSDLEQITNLIESDPGLRARLLRVANPRAESVADYTIETVEEALMRNGLGCAMLITMGTPLGLALTKTFQTMLSTKLESIDPAQAIPLQGEHIVGTIGFSGKALGRVYLRLSLQSAQLLASGILGLGSDDVLEPNEIRDTAGELLNIMTGNFKSNLCDSGLDCRLEPPQVHRTTDLSTPTVPGGGLERMAFRSGRIVLFVSVTVNPFND